MLCQAVDTVGQSHKRNNNQQKESPMKLNRMITQCAIAAALALSVGNLLAQDDGGGPGGPGGPGGFGGPGGMGGPGGGNFDPAQMQQMMMQRYQEQLGITNDTDWNAIQPLVQKVMDAQRAARGNMGRMFGRGGPGGPGGPGGFGQQQSDPAADALQQALDSSAPTGQIKDLLTKYQASQKAKQATLTAAQNDLRKVLTVQQEAQATLMGLLN
jgi:Spy/CpxP family protein refolding chaperone